MPAVRLRHRRRVLDARQHIVAVGVEVALEREPVAADEVRGARRAVDLEAAGSLLLHPDARRALAIREDIADADSVEALGVLARVVLELEALVAGDVQRWVTWPEAALSWIVATTSRF